MAFSMPATVTVMLFFLAVMFSPWPRLQRSFCSSDIVSHSYIVYVPTSLMLGLRLFEHIVAVLRCKGNYNQAARAWRPQEGMATARGHGDRNFQHGDRNFQHGDRKGRHYYTTLQVRFRV